MLLAHEKEFLDFAYLSHLKVVAVLKKYNPALSVDEALSIYNESAKGAIPPNAGCKQGDLKKNRQRKDSSLLGWICLLLNDIWKWTKRKVVIQHVSAF